MHVKPYGKWSIIGYYVEINKWKPDNNNNNIAFKYKESGGLLEMKHTSHQQKEKFVKSMH